MNENVKNMADTLCDAGWLWMSAEELREGEQGFAPEPAPGKVFVGPVTEGGDRFVSVLVHPDRPEAKPDYEPGTIVQARTAQSNKVVLLTRVDTSGEKMWASITFLAESGHVIHYREDDVKILRVICGPNGEDADSAEDRPAANMMDQMRENPELIARDAFGDFWRYNEHSGNFEWINGFPDSVWWEMSANHALNYLGTNAKARWSSMDELNKMREQA